MDTSALIVTIKAFFDIKINMMGTLVVPIIYNLLNISIIAVYNIVTAGTISFIVLYVLLSNILKYLTILLSSIILNTKYWFNLYEGDIYSFLESFKNIHPICSVIYDGTYDVLCGYYLLAHEITQVSWYHYETMTDIYNFLDEQYTKYYKIIKKLFIDCPERIKVIIKITDEMFMNFFVWGYGVFFISRTILLTASGLSFFPFSPINAIVTCVFPFYVFCLVHVAYQIGIRKGLFAVAVKALEKWFT